MAASRMLILRRCKLRRFFPSPPSFSSVPCGGGSIQTSNQLVNPHPVPAPSLPPASSSPIPFSTRRSKNSVLPLAVLSTVLASSSLYYYHLHYRNESTAPVSGSTDASTEPTTSFFYSQLELFNRILSQMRQTGLAAAVLWQSLKSVMTSAEHEVRLGFSLRVASLLADIAAANQSRRKAIVGAGGGKVVDWLLDTVAFDKILGTQDEAARALAYLIADQNVVKDVLGRPNAVPNLLRFIFSCQPKRSKQSRRNSFDISDSLKGRSMLVTAIMDIVTSSCDSSDKVSFQPYLTGIAETRDIAAAIEVIEEGGMDMDGSNRDIEDDDDDGGIGVKGIGMKVLGGTTVVGLSRTSGLIRSESSNGNYGDRSKQFPGTLASRQNHDSLAQTTSDVVPGLWDDLISEHVAVPFAAWALANWSVASDVNRTRIHELDRDGYAILNALLAPERSVKFHGSLAARSLLEDHNLPLNDYVADWSCSLLSIVSQGSKNEDIPLVKVALSAFFVSVDRSRRAQKAVMDKGLHLIRESATCMTKYTDVQESLARVIELLCTRDMHLSLLESQKWSGILLKWIFGKQSSEITRSSAANILSCIFEDYGSSSIPISQGWLTLLLNEILSSKRPLKGSAKPKSDKVQTQIDQLNIASAGVVVNQLAGAVVSLGSKQSVTTNSDGHSPLSDFLSLEPFAGQLKGSKTANLPKLDAADSAVATLKGVKMLTELCSEDSLCQNKIVEWGVLCLLRRLLLRDDYENLAATEAYDASRDSKFQERGSSGQGESSSKANDSSNVRVPPTAHIRRHAARLLTILSLLPKVQKVLLADKTWCRWLEDCANGKISGCDDLKIRSYARATLLNVSCNEQNDENSGNNDDSGQGTANKARNCPRFSDMILLVNPEMPHWKLPEETEPEPAQEKPMPDSLNKSSPNTDAAASASLSTSVSEGGSQSKVPLVDIVFVHGIQGGPFKTWRITDDKSSTKSGFVEKIDQEAGKEGTFWPGEWLPADFHHARLFTLKYKTNLTQWSGASLPLQEVSSMLLEKLAAAGIGERPVVFVTHSMGGLLVKQMLYKAKDRNIDNLVNNTIGIAFYTCPHFGSKLADVPWRMGLVFRPAPSVGELRSGCSRLVELNDFIRQLHKNGQLDVLSFCETKVTPIVEGYGGWAFRMEIVPIESAYPGFGELVVLESTDHINSCKPLSHSDPSYTELLKFLHKLKDKRDEKVQGSSVIV